VSRASSTGGADHARAVSVVIPAYQAAQTLEETLASLAAQTHTGWEAIVVDDGSRDATLAVAQRVAARDSRVRPLPKANAGVSAARNAGIAAARHPWLLFLDADDLLVPHALERFVHAVSGTASYDLAYSGWERLMADGRRVDETMAMEPADLFGMFAQTCAFAIHACLVRRSLITALGGFDESLVTCEDWDLWQRLVRTGARAVRIPERLAIYRARPQSASNNPVRMIEDGFRVIDRGHGPDERVASHERYRAGQDPRGIAAARTGLAAYGLGLAISQGGDTDRLFELADLSCDIAADPRALGSTVAYAVALGRGLTVGDWLSFPPELWGRAAGVFRRLEAQLGIPHGATRAQRGFEDAILEKVTDARPLRVGSRYIVDVDLDRLLVDLDVPEGVERVHVHARYRGEALGELVLPAIGPQLAAWALADAAAAQWAWQLLGAFLGFGALAGDDDRVWEHFVQELWGLPELTNADFYDPALPIDEVPAAMPAGGPIEVARPLPATPAGCAAVAVTVGGAALGAITLDPRAPGTPQRLRAAITLQGGFELCVMVARQALIGQPADGAGTLRERLARRAQEQAGDSLGALATAAVIGRRTPLPGGAPARRWILPPAAVPAALDDARAAGWPVHPAGPGAPLVHDAERDLDAATGQLAPWGAGLPTAPPEDPYEREKRDRVVALVPGLASASVLLMGGDEELRRRLGAAGRLTVATPASIPTAGAFDAVICFETLQYTEIPARLDAALRQLLALLAPGGVLVSAHPAILLDEPSQRAFVDGLPFGADTIDRSLHRLGTAACDADERGDGYRLQRWRRARRSGRLGRAVARLRRSRGGKLTEPAPPHVAAALRDAADSAALLGPRAAEVPILMYHRIADDGAEQTARWRLPPAQLEAQLAWLRDAGYHGTSLAELTASVVARKPLPGKPVILSFDDAYVDFATAAWPLLTRYGFGATLFAVSHRVGRFNEWDAQMGERVDLLDWHALRSLRADGVELGSHSATHPAMTALAPATMAEEALSSRAAFRRELGFTPTLFAYPYGDVDDLVWRTIGACGYEAAVTCEARIVHLHDQPLLLPRVEVTGDLDAAGLQRAIDAAAPQGFAAARMPEADLPSRG
jgi:peptidoglycan/xylan/chitin deacetylase (PgdA/CDA1 family)